MALPKRLAGAFAVFVLAGWMSGLPVHRANAQAEQPDGRGVERAVERRAPSRSEPQAQAPANPRVQTPADARAQTPPSRVVKAADPRTQTPNASTTAPNANAQTPNPRQAAARAATTPVKAVEEPRIPLKVYAIAAALLILGVGIMLYCSTRSPDDPAILRLRPSFFFWLGMGYAGLLLLGAVAFADWHRVPGPCLLGGILPVAVPWFGALGAVTISLEGVFMWNQQWDGKYNYWHIGRPIFGAVLGIVAFFIYVLIISASGTPPKFLDNPAEVKGKDFILFYMVAFLVGYREETFRELIKRVSDLILKPGGQGAAAPAVSIKIGNQTKTAIAFGKILHGKTATLTVHVTNTGSVPLAAPDVTVSATDPAPVATFAAANDKVKVGGDLVPGHSRTVDVKFAPAKAGHFAGTLTVTAANLAAPKVFQITGTGT